MMENFEWGPGVVDELDFGSMLEASFVIAFQEK